MSFRRLLVLALAAAACTPTASDSSSAELPSSDELAGSRLKRARRASFALANVSVIQGALFQAAMGGEIVDRATELGKGLAGPEGKGVEEPEAKKLADEALQEPLLEALTAVDVFKGAKGDKRVDLARLYNHKVLQRGVKLDEQRPKALGTAPLTRKLKPKELERYVLLLSVPDSKQKDVKALQKSFAEQAKWLEEVTERAKDDQELAKAMEALGRPPSLPSPPAPK